VSEAEDDPVTAAILAATAERGPGKSICPSEVARALAHGGADWHAQMHAVREAARRLARSGRIDILRKGKKQDPENFKGVIRLRIKEAE
jgi:hypothetical protein